MSHKNKEKKQFDLNKKLQNAVEEVSEEMPAESEEVIQETESETEQTNEEIKSELETEVAKWKDIAFRSQAEMENLRKRTQIDIEKAHRYANASFAKDLLPVADNLSGAIDFAQKEIEKAKNAGTECDTFLVNLLKGVEMTQKQLQTVFEHHQIKKMETLGIVFDPNLHKVIQEIEDAEKEPGTIIQELQAGYTIGGDRVLREAMVIVSK